MGLYSPPLTMLSPDVRFDGFSAADWLALGGLLRSAPPEGEPKGGILAVTLGGKLQKLCHTERGRVEPEDSVWHGDPRALAEQHGAAWALVVHAGALTALSERVAERTERRHTLLEQLLTFAAVVKELEGEGALELWPFSLRDWPVPSLAMCSKALDALCPNGHSAVLGVFEGGSLLTCCAVRRGPLGFDWVMGPEQLRPAMGLLSGDFRRDYRHLRLAVEERLGPLKLGCFGERGALFDLLHHPAPGAWATAVASREVIVSPVAPAIALPLGMDVGRAALGAMRLLAEQLESTDWFGMKSRLSPTLERARGVAFAQVDIQELLGFDPLGLLRALVGSSRTHRSEQPGPPRR
jgi:hypothetical protein